ncbi:MAG TPA: HEAT repeat domain-containing protein, partial [Thermoanaerobaculia bacterium]|nr:HEAT repeat domain-containing protein [Thermoanaerobaculia bacterium]
MTLRDLLADPSPEVRAAAYRSLRGARSLQALRLLTAGLDDPHDAVVTAAAEVMMETQDAGPRALVAFHPRPAARRVAVRVTEDVELLYLMLADAETRTDTIDRLRLHPPIGGTDERAAILRRLLADGSLPPPDAARLFRDDPDSLSLLVMQLARTVIDAAKGEPEIVYDRPTGMHDAVAVPPPFVTIIQLLDAVPGAWRAALAHRHVFTDAESARMAFLSWLSLTVHAMRHHAAHASWNAEALAIESSTMPWLLLEGSIPLHIRRDALRAAAGITGQKVDPTVFGWDGAFVLTCLFDPVSRRESGVHDLRAAYALLDVRSGGTPLKAMHARLGTAAVVRAAEEGAADLAWMIGATPLRRSDHEIAEEWLAAIATAEPRAFIEITRSLPIAWWIEAVRPLGTPMIENLLAALADSDAPSATWSSWAAALTGSQPSASAILDQRGYRVVRAGTTAFPGSPTAAQRKSAERLGVPPIIEHRATGIVFVLIPGGELLIGAPDTDPEAYDREKPQRLATVETFYLAVTPVTQSQWRGEELP